MLMLLPLRLLRFYLAGQAWLDLNICKTNGFAASVF
jgi:hypothetical protein